jgi:hypothetical protein
VLTSVERVTRQLSVNLYTRCEGDTALKIKDQAGKRQSDSGGCCTTREAIIATGTILVGSTNAAETVSK